MVLALLGNEVGLNLKPSGGFENFGRVEFIQTVGVAQGAGLLETRAAAQAKPNNFRLRRKGRGVAWVRRTVNGHHWNPNGRCKVHEARVVGDHQARQGQEIDRLCQGGLSGQIHD